MSALKDPQRELFCQELHGGATKAQAHERAGYPKLQAARGRTADKLYQTKWCKGRMKELILEDLGKSRHRHSITRDFILSNMTDVLDRCMGGVAYKDKRGIETGEYKFDATGALKALHMLGLEHGMFNPEKKTRHGRLDSPLDNMSGKEMIKFVEGKMKSLSTAELEMLGFVRDNEPGQLVEGEGGTPDSDGDTPARQVPTLQ